LRPTDVATLRAVWRGEQKWVTNSAPPRKATPRRSGPPSLPERARAPATPPPPAAADAPRIHEGRDSHATSNATFVADRPSSAPRRWPALVAVVVGVFVLALAARLAMG
jgi:hypothetical protein